MRFNVSKAVEPEHAHHPGAPGSVIRTAESQGGQRGCHPQAVGSNTAAPGRVAGHRKPPALQCRTVSSMPLNRCCSARSRSGAGAPGALRSRLRTVRRPAEAATDMSDPTVISHRRQRIHELVLALLAQQGDLELLDGDAGAPPPATPVSGSSATAGWCSATRPWCARPSPSTR